MTTGDSIISGELVEQLRTLVDVWRAWQAGGASGAAQRAAAARTAVDRVVELAGAELVDEPTGWPELDDGGECSACHGVGCPACNELAAAAQEASDRAASRPTWPAEDDHSPLDWARRYAAHAAGDGHRRLIASTVADRGVRSDEWGAMVTWALNELDELEPDGEG